MFAMIPHSQDSQWSYHTWTLKSQRYNIRWWLRKRRVFVCVCVLFCFVVGLNIAAGLLNKETRGWIPRGQVLYTHWKATFISSEYMIMERRMVLSKQYVQDISMDHEKLLHSQNWWKKSHRAALKIFFFQKLDFSKDLGLRLLSEFLALCKKKTLFSEFGYLCLLVYNWGEGVTKRDCWGTAPESSSQEKTF